MAQMGHPAGLTRYPKRPLWHWEDAGLNGIVEAAWGGRGLWRQGPRVGEGSRRPVWMPSL